MTINKLLDRLSP
jgi:Ca2+-binding EF-hand superfamily protein